MDGPLPDLDFDLPDSDRSCPNCGTVMKLARTASSPSPAYEAHTFVCPACAHYFTARVELPKPPKRSRKSLSPRATG